jgi:hypothetical protein
MMLHWMLVANSSTRVVRVSVYYTTETTTDILGIPGPAGVTPGPAESRQFG